MLENLHECIKARLHEAMLQHTRRFLIIDILK